jgi:hypothetical protein
MKRYYFVSEDLDDLALVEQQLEQAGIGTPQIHVLSENDEGVEQRHLHEVNSLMKRDVVHSWKVGAFVGAAAAAAVVLIAYLGGLAQTAAGWVPLILLAIIVFGFCAWVAGLLGLRRPNAHFKQFQQELKAGKHIFFIEASGEQEALAANVIKQHPNLMALGSAAATPGWFISWQKKWSRFVEVMP